MTERIEEYASSDGLKLAVNREAGIIPGVKILGLQSKNNRSYLPAAIKKAPALYENARCNVNHSGGPRDYQDRIGDFRGVRAEADGLYGDFHFNPKHALAEQLIWDAEHAPHRVGFSHVVDAKVDRKDGRAVVIEIVAVQSVDLVADPATTKGLFEHKERDMELKDLTLEQLRESRPDLVVILEGKDELTKTKALWETTKAELAAVKESLATANAAIQAAQVKEAAHAKVIAIAEELKAAKLDTADKVACSDAFMASLQNAADAAARKVLIEDRTAILRRTPQIQTSPPMGVVGDAAYTQPPTVEETLRRL